MAGKVVQRARVRGYRPTGTQLREMLGIAQKDFCGTAEAHVVYSKGNREIFPDEPDIGEVLPRHIDEIIKEAGDPDELNNLHFSISQTSPMREIDIRIGFGGYTAYRIESDDQTWAYGRYHELTDKLMSDRSRYAKFRSGRPEILKEGTDDEWQTTAWEVSKDWHVTAVGVAASLPWWPVVAAVLYGISVTGGYVSPGSNAVDRQDHELALRDVHNLAAHSSIITILALAYVFALFSYRRQLRNLLKSKIMVRKSPVISQFSFRDAKSGAVALASFYVALFACIVATIADIIH